MLVLRFVEVLQEIVNVLLLFSVFSASLINVEHDQVVSILSRRGRCERASIDEVYLDLSDAARTMLDENPLDQLESISEEALKSHVLGLHLVQALYPCSLLFSSARLYTV